MDLTDFARFISDQAVRAHGPKKIHENAECTHYLLPDDVHVQYKTFQREHQFANLDQLMKYAESTESDIESGAFAGHPLLADITSDKCVLWLGPGRAYLDLHYGALHDQMVWAPMKYDVAWRGVRALTKRQQHKPLDVWRLLHQYIFTQQGAGDEAAEQLYLSLQSLSIMKTKDVTISPTGASSQSLQFGVVTHKGTTPCELPRQFSVTSHIWTDASTRDLDGEWLCAPQTITLTLMVDTTDGELCMAFVPNRPVEDMEDDQLARLANAIEAKRDRRIMVYAGYPRAVGDAPDRQA